MFATDRALGAFMRRFVEFMTRTTTVVFDRPAR